MSENCESMDVIRGFIGDVDYCLNDFNDICVLRMVKGICRIRLC